MATTHTLVFARTEFDKSDKPIGTLVEVEFNDSVNPPIALRARFSNEESVDLKLAIETWAVQQELVFRKQFFHYKKPIEIDVSSIIIDSAKINQDADLLNP